MNGMQTYSHRPAQPKHNTFQGEREEQFKNCACVYNRKFVIHKQNTFEDEMKVSNNCIFILFPLFHPLSVKISAYASINNILNTFED